VVLGKGRFVMRWLKSWAMLFIDKNLPF
jgi:hypothetical protein